MGEARYHRLKDAAASHARVSIAFLPVLLLLRAYELAITAATHVLPEGLAGLLLRSLGLDLRVFLAVTAVSTPIILLGLWRPRVAGVVQRLLLVTTALLAVALAQYFAITFTPLGADLYGYTWSEIWETTNASGGETGVTRFLPFIVAAGVTWFLTGLASRIRTSPKFTPGFLALAAFGFGLMLLKPARATGFASDSAYFLASNKTEYWARQTAAYFRQPAVEAGAAALGEYPLLRPATEEDVLGPLMNLPAEQPPNIVLLVVEGLGSEFVGPGAYYGGFTPFLDSLTAEALYWPNFVSTSGRSFGALPAIAGSLPYGQAGFMELGSRMPVHHSLPSLLASEGWATNFFTGTDGHYDFVDLFVERQGVGRFIDQANFPASFTRAPAAEGGFSWGYADEDLFRHSLQVLGTAAPEPRLDIYLTTTSHEPFIPPRVEAYRSEFRRRLATLRVDEERRAVMQRYAGVFETLLYVDDAIQYFVSEYRKRPEFARTALFITGDHRLIPIPPRTRIARYHVPLLITSPMVKAPRRFESVSSHLDLTPSILAMLKRNYALDLPDQVHWLGTGIDTTSEFRNVHALPLMRAKNALDEYLDGTYFLSQGELFELEPGMLLRDSDQAERRAEVARKLVRFQAVNRLVTTSPALYPADSEAIGDRVAAARADSAFAALGLDTLDPDELFTLARSKAIEGEYEYARTILRHMLREVPNQHDARTLLGRSYGWERRFEEARIALREVTRRAPQYVDGWIARIEVELWAEQPQTALAEADSGLAALPGHPDIVAARARAATRAAAGQ